MDTAKKKKEVEKEVKEKPKVNLKQVMENLVGKDGLKRYFLKIKEILKEYMDLDEEYYSLISLWIMGTYLHKQFPAYPYLFFNAMKGSGKTRVLKIISNLAYNGKVVGSMTEAVLFRTASQRTLCIDEFENINAKGNENLKLLINSAYKRGTTIERMAKKGEDQVVEEFEVYSPITMANIQGMDNVLADRCLSVILEKSSKIKITKLIENFEHNIEFKIIRGGLKGLTELISPSDDIFGGIFTDWNAYIKKKDVSESNKKTTKNKAKKQISKENTYIFDISYIFDINLEKLFKKINNTNISGRDLELFLPLFIISDICGEDVLNDTLNLSKKVVKEKREIDREENKDVKIYEFIAQSDYQEYVNTSDIAKEFSDFYDEDPKYNTSRSMGMALNRLKLILEKRNTGKKRQVKLNISKAKEKLLLFKEVQEQKDVRDVRDVSDVKDVRDVSNNNNNLLNQFTDDEIKQAGYTRDDLEKELK